MGSRGGASHNTTVNGGSGALPLSLQFFARKEAIDAQRMIRDAGLSQQEIDYLQGQLKKLIDSNDFAMRVKRMYVESIIDTHFMNQMETGTSQGANAPNMRAELSSQYFGHPYDRPDKVAPGEFEKYGYLAPRSIVGAQTIAGADWYGDVVFRFRREAVIDRTTFKTDDTLNTWSHSRSNAHAGSLSNPSVAGFVSLSHDTVRKVKSAERHIKDPDSWVGEVNYGDYFELQYHGSLTIKDVASVTFGEQLPNNSDRVIQKLKKNGVKVYQVRRGAYHEL